MKILVRFLLAFALFGAGILAGRWSRSAPVASVGRTAESPRRAEPEVRSTQSGNVGEAPVLAAVRLRRGQPVSEAQFEELLAALSTLASQDPAAALAYALDQLPQPRCDQAASMVLGVWAQNEPTAAWRWVEARQPMNSGFLDAVLSSIGRTNPQQAWALATDSVRLHPEQAQGICVSGLRGVLHAGAFDLATTFVGTVQLPNSEEKFDLYGLVSGEWARHDPLAAAAWVTQLPEGLERKQALLNLAQTWSETDPRAASMFAARLAPGEARQMMLTQAVADWAVRSPAEVAAWVAEEKQHPNFDQVVSAVATAPRMLTDNLSGAIGWADTIIDDELRQQTLTQIMRHWLDRDAAAANEYLAHGSDLSAETRAELRKRLGLER